ncbi:MAG: TetR/AcrR family transcriptional regulator [Vicingaceae bacterium]
MANKKFTKRQLEIIEAAMNRIDAYGIQKLTITNLAADLDLSEGALYRHFKNKNSILNGLLTYFIEEMDTRTDAILMQKNKNATAILRELFTSQLEKFTEKPAIVSVIFSEGIFQFNKEMNEKVSLMMEIMQNKISQIIENGQSQGNYTKLLSVSATSTIIMGSMRMVVLKWKVSGHKSNLLNNGLSVLNGIIKLIKR